jgi:hypothetical protein
MVPRWARALGAAALVLAGPARGDLPVHCMGDEFLGAWDVKMTEPSASDLYSVSGACGHTRPNLFTGAVASGDGYSTWYGARQGPSWSIEHPTRDFRLCVPLANGSDARLCELEASAAAAGADPCAGSWSGPCSPVKFTLLYDEGFLLSTHPFADVHIKMVGFFKYRPSTAVAPGGAYPALSALEQWESLCDETVTGFWSTHGHSVVQDGKVFRGCFVAKKTTPLPAHSSEMRGSGIAVLDPVVSPNRSPALLEVAASARLRSRVRAALHEREREQEQVFLQQSMRVSSAAVAQLNAAGLGWHASAESAAALGGSNADALARLGVTSASRSAFRQSSYARKLMQLADDSASGLRDEEEGGARAAFASDVPMGPDPWAKPPPPAAPLQGAQRASVIAQLHKTELKLSVADSAEEKAADELETACALSVLPDKFDWSDPSTTGCASVVPAAKDQGGCGSCYAMAASRAMTMRMRIAFHPDPTCQPNASLAQAGVLGTDLSAQSILDCSYVNEGCDGGYPSLGAFHAYAEGLYAEQCDPYSGKSNVCAAKPAQCAPTYAEDFNYAGGSYGYGTSMHAMMVELVKFGPMTVALEAEPDLQLYRSGVFRSFWKRQRDTIKGAHSFWQKTNHAVTLVGWDTLRAPDGKVTLTWRIQNSWGDRWGDNGYFNMVRGTDDIAVETMPVSIKFGDGPVTVKGKELIAAYESCVAKGKARR